jgi:hypothetical protein
MKLLLLVLIGFLCTATGYADCTFTGFQVFPNGPTIRQNSIFVLEGYGDSQRVISGLNQTYSIYLKSGQKKIKLLVTEICVGQYQLTQAVLKPETALEAGRGYTLYIDDLPKNENVNPRQETAHRYDLATYMVIPETDLKKPELYGKPKELKKTLVHYGCGPSVHVVFSNPAKDKSDILVKTTVKSLKTGKQTTYYIKPEGNKIKVGHGMCSGAFDFDESQAYEVEFSFMDAAGNLTAWTDEPIKFTKPTQQTNHEDE